jgi:hypothetical protein
VREIPGFDQIKMTHQLHGAEMTAAARASGAAGAGRAKGEGCGGRRTACGGEIPVIRAARFIRATSAPRASCRLMEPMGGGDAPAVSVAECDSDRGAP